MSGCNGCRALDRAEGRADDLQERLDKIKDELKDYETLCGDLARLVREAQGDWRQTLDVDMRIWDDEATAALARCPQ